MFIRTNVTIKPSKKKEEVKEETLTIKKEIKQYKVIFPVVEKEEETVVEEEILEDDEI